MPSKAKSEHRLSSQKTNCPIQNDATPLQMTASLLLSTFTSPFWWKWVATAISTCAPCASCVGSPSFCNPVQYDNNAENKHKISVGALIIFSSKQTSFFVFHIAQQTWSIPHHTIAFLLVNTRKPMVRTVQKKQV